MSKPIRVLHVFGEMNRGGAETMVMNLYRHIDRDKIQFDFIVHTEEECHFNHEIELLGGKIYQIPRYTGKNHFQYKKSWNDFFINHREYSIIHGHVRSTAAIYLKIAKKYGLITIAHSHSTSSGKGLSAIVKNVMQLPIRNIADYLLACSKAAGYWLFGEKACKKNNFFLLKNAIDVEKFIFNQKIRNKIRKEFNLEGKFVIGNIARFHPQKNHTFLIDIFKNVYDKNKNAVLMLVGQGDLQEQIKKKVDILELTNNVIFTGVRSDIPDLLQAMDIFVFPSLSEGLGIAVVEAQASGLKCIVSDQIPEEAILSNLVEKVSLSRSPEFWCEKILENINYERKETAQLVKSAGYDIRDTTKWIEEFYLGMV